MFSLNDIVTNGVTLGFWLISSTQDVNLSLSNAFDNGFSGSAFPDVFDTVPYFNNEKQSSTIIFYSILFTYNFEGRCNSSFELNFIYI